MGSMVVVKIEWHFCVKYIYTYTHTSRKSSEFGEVFQEVEISVRMSKNNEQESRKLQETVSRTLSKKSEHFKEEFNKFKPISENFKQNFEELYGWILETSGQHPRCSGKNSLSFRRRLWEHGRGVLGKDPRVPRRKVLRTYRENFGEKVRKLQRGDSNSLGKRF